MLANLLYLLSRKEKLCNTLWFKYYTIIDWWWGQHMICWTWRQNVARGRRPRASFCLKVQHIICCPNPQSIIVLLYLHWFSIKYSNYCKRGNFCMGVIFAFFALKYSSRKLTPRKIKAKWLYEENRSRIVKNTPTGNVFPTFSRNIPPAKITTFTVYITNWPWSNWPQFGRIDLGRISFSVN